MKVSEFEGMMPDQIVDKLAKNTLANERTIDKELIKSALMALGWRRFNSAFIKHWWGCTFVVYFTTHVEVRWIDGDGNEGLLGAFHVQFDDLGYSEFANEEKISRIKQALEFIDSKVNDKMKFILGGGS